MSELITAPYCTSFLKLTVFRILGVLRYLSPVELQNVYIIVIEGRIRQCGWLYLGQKWREIILCAFMSASGSDIPDSPRLDCSTRNE